MIQHLIFFELGLAWAEALGIGAPACAVCGQRKEEKLMNLTGDKPICKLCELKGVEYV